MTLTLTSLRLANFGPYYGEQTVDLAVPTGSPVVVIHGENTLGKTQLFSALRWCLYGTFAPQQSAVVADRAARERLNRISAREGNKEFSVRVMFEVDGEQYALTRRAVDVGDRVDTAADLRIGATVVPAADIDAEIGRLLHPQISEFFLFDAELLERFYARLNTDRERAFIRESIESVLGIPALQRAEHDVAALALDAAKRQAKAAKDTGEASRLNAEVRRLSDERQSLENDRRTTQDRLREAERTLEQLRDQLGAREGLQADAREHEFLESQVVDGARESDLLANRMRALISDGWLTVAAHPLAKALAKIRDANSAAQAEQSAIEAARTKLGVLEDRVRGGRCPACGQLLPAPDAATEAELASAKTNLQSLLDASGGGVVDLQRERQIAGLVDTATVKRLRETHERLNTLALLQYERKQRMEAINDRLRGHKAADIRSLGQQIVRTEAAITSTHQILKDIERRLTDIGSEEQSAMRRLTRLKGSQPDAALEATFFAFVRTAFDQTVDRYRERVRSEVEAAANAMFLQLIHDPEGYGGLRIGPDYKIEVLDQFKVHRETSEGGKQLLALSLIGALKQAAVRGGPVVLDSPLGRLDREHRARVLQVWVPSLGNQAVLLVQSGELTVQEGHELLGSMIGREYRITRPAADPEYAMVERSH